MNLRDIVNPWLIRFGAEPYRFWLLTDLFDELSSRREMWGSLGRSGVTLKVLGSLYAVLMTIMTFGMVSSAPPFFNYSAFLMGFGGFILGMVLISETSTSLVNVEEGTLLAHQPINGATYTLSKLAHILQVLLWLVPMVNGAPALGSLFLKDKRESTLFSGHFCRGSARFAKTAPFIGHIMISHKFILQFVVLFVLPLHYLLLGLGHL